ncbi:hypothetical protein ONA91_16450 [Micromonospora sp. DR5-3]|uniref:hypothetical protein n=1 Tax=unclassified Micromonospora TaxID=2617518 RepID=UPI0011D40A8A|nr:MULTISPECIES: hypothetical protein [unclassified Micromonospora]MCW3816034.1 hypothetical protein [Micromonospora sp. DR5-3]TYC21288.1 hypothetical protein FXF52_26835 [Micromonospora sp. MP36]
MSQRKNPAVPSRNAGGAAARRRVAGAPTRRPAPADARSATSRIIRILGAFALGALVAAAVAALVARPDPVQRKVDELRAADAARDAVQITELTAQARSSAQRLGPVLQGLATAVPIDPDAAPALAPASTVAGWRQVAQQVAREYDNPPSGATATNIARESFAMALDQLVAAVETYDSALRAEGAQRVRLLDLAREQRNLAVRAWAVGATQLDVLNIDAGHGHAHVFLPAGSGTGAFNADPEPEGSHR